MSPSGKPSQPRKRRTFSIEFKAEAVRIARSSQKPLAVVARELDISESCLHEWIRKSKVDERRDPAGELTTDERSELVRLRRELRVAQEERDFLKKAAAYFAKNQS